MHAVALKRRRKPVRRAEQRATGETGEEMASWDRDDASFREQVMNAYVAVVYYSIQSNARRTRALAHTSYLNELVSLANSLT